VMLNPPIGCWHHNAAHHQCTTPLTRALSTDARECSQGCRADAMWAWGALCSLILPQQPPPAHCRPQQTSVTLCLCWPREVGVCPWASLAALGSRGSSRLAVVSPGLGYCRVRPDRPSLLRYRAARPVLAHAGGFEF
jgi:hypothetical protein